MRTPPLNCSWAGKLPSLHISPLKGRAESASTDLGIMR